MRLRNVNFLVDDAFMDEVLLSRPLLSCMSLYLDNHLNKVFNTFLDADFSHVGGTIYNVMESHEPSKQARILLRAEDNAAEEAFYYDHLNPDEAMERERDRTQLPIDEHEPKKV